MFDFIRNHRRWMQFILLLLILPSFVFIGVQGYTSFMDNDPELAIVADQPVTLQQFDSARRNQLEQYRERLGVQFDLSLIDTPASRQRLLDQLIEQQLLVQVASDGRFSVSDEALRRTIAGIPAVQEEGRFSPERYRQVLAAQGMTPAIFETGLRRDMAVARVLQPVTVSAQVPADVVQRVRRALTEQRTVQLRRFEAASYREASVVTDAQAQAWYDTNRQQLEIPEQVEAEYIVLNEAAATTSVTVSDQDIAAYYQQNQSRFGQAERRRASHILIAVPADAPEAVRKEARTKAESLAREAAAQPSGFAALARQHSQDPGSAQAGGELGWISRGMLVGPVEDAIFSLGSGQISGVVESPFGFHIIDVTEVQPASVKPLDQVREQVAAEIRKQAAAQRFSEIATELTKLVYEQTDSLQPIADQLGLKVRKAGGITRDGLLDAARAGPNAAQAGADAQLLGNPRVRQALFSQEVLRDKRNSGLIELSPDTMIAVRVASIKPAHVPAFDSVKTSILDRLRDEGAAAAAARAGKEALESLQQGKTQAGEGFGVAQTVTRAQPPQEMSGPVLEAIMRAPPTVPAYVGVEQGRDYLVVRIEKIESGPEDAAALAPLKDQLAMALGQAEERAVIQLMRQQHEVKILPAAQSAVAGQEPPQ